MYPPGWSMCYKKLLDFHHWRIDTSRVHALGPESGFTKSSKGNFKYILTLKDWKGVIQWERVCWLSLAPNIVMHTQLSLKSSACDTQDKWCSQLSGRIWGFHCRSIADSGLWLKKTPNHHYFSLYSNSKLSRIICSYPLCTFRAISNLQALIIGPLKEKTIRNVVIILLFSYLAYEGCKNPSFFMLGEQKCHLFIGTLDTCSIFMRQKKFASETQDLIISMQYAFSLNEDHLKEWNLLYVKSAYVSHHFHLFLLEKIYC